MPYENIVNNLIDAGPITSLAVAFVLITLIMLGMMIVINRMFRAFVELQKSTNQQIELSREAVGKFDSKVNELSSAIAKIADAEIDTKIEIGRLKNLFINKLDSSERKLTNIENVISSQLIPIISSLDGMQQSVVDLEQEIVRTYQKIINEFNTNRKEIKNEENKDVNASITGDVSINK